MFSYSFLQYFSCLFLIASGTNLTQRSLSLDTLANQADSVQLVGTFRSKAYYIGTGPPLTWKDAWAFCRSHQMHLVSIESKSEQAYVIQFVHAVEHTCWWLGGTDALEEGKWVWMSSGRDFGYNLWEGGNPNNAGGNECCVELCPWGGTEFGYAWNDLANGNKKRYVCEAKPDQPSPYLLVKL